MGNLSKRVGIVGAALATAATMAVLPSGAQAEPSGAGTADPSSAPALLDVGAPASTSAAQVTDARQADVDTSLLQRGVAQTVSIDVLATDLEVDLQPMASGAPGWAAWDGSVVGEPASSVTVVRKGDDVSGVVATPDGTYRIRTTAPGQQVVQVIDRDFTESLDDAVTPPVFDLGIDPPAAGDTAGAPPAEGDVPTYPVIDVLVGYTPGALTDAGNSTSAMNSEIALAIATSNQAYQDSGVIGRLRLAGTTPVTEDYSLSSSSLQSIWDPSDGYADSIHTLRNSTGADLVSVLVHDPSSCGLGYLLTAMTTASDRSRYGFSTVNYSCAVSNYSFPHELGHNMGLDHDRYVEPSPTLYPYSVGYVNLAQQWRTIMAYNNQCADQNPSFNCTRIGRFSNPDLTYNGFPTGRPSTGPTPADNRKALNNTQAFVASWRAKPAPFTSWAKFVAQQYKDFQGRAPSGSESSTDTGILNTGVKTPQAYVDGQLKGSFGASYAPVTRLYFAYFRRSPDPGGLDYWVKKYKAGMKLSAISSNFAASNEFKSKYGSLTNRAFVNKIYENLFERTGDTGGVNHWTAALDSKAKTRGEVMISFSESTEFKRVRAEEIDVVLLYRSMLQRSATPSEFADKVARLQGGAGIQRLILEILDSAAYSGRVVK